MENRPTLLFLDGAGNRVPAELGDADDPAWQALLHRHLDRIGREPILCTCTEPAPKIYTRRLGAQDKCFLAIYPESGPTHDSQCWFWRPDIEQSGLKGYVDRVVRHEGDQLVVSLRHGLVRTQPQDDAPEVRTAMGTGQPRRRHRAMTALGLLHLLWEEARINHWHPRFQQTRWWPAVTALRQMATRIRIRQRGGSPVAVAARCVFIPPRMGERDTKAYAETIWPIFQPERRKRGGDRIMVLGKVTGFWDKPHAVRMPSVPDLYLNLAADDHAGLSARHEQLATMSDQVVGLFMLETRGVDKHGKMRCQVIEAGMMACTDALIPVDSRLEHEVACRLIEADRRFYKPLRYDADADAVLPDFVLLDAGMPHPMEVYGMDTPSYLARKEEKETYYAEQFPGRHWKWDAIDGGAIPPFPVRRFR